MARKLLQTLSRTVSGHGIIPNGVSGESTVQASGGFGITSGGWTLIFYSNNGFGYGGSPYDQGPADVGCGVQYGSGSSSTRAARSARLEEGVSGRGGEYIDFSFSFTGMANLYVDTEGEPDADTPDENYPNYGGARTPGEFPSNYGRLNWEWVPGAAITATATIGPRTASLTAVGVLPSESISVFGKIIDDSFADSGGVRAEINWDGFPSAGGTRSIVANGRHDGIGPEGFAYSVEIGDGFMRITNRGWMRAVNTNPSMVEVYGDMTIPRVANVDLDALAMGHPHPHACEWKVVDYWQHVVDPDGDPSTMNEIVEPPIPHVATLTGQHVTLPIRQFEAGADVFATNVAVTSEVRNGWRPAQGIRGGQFRTYQHYEDTRGPVLAWIVPPPGEDPADWRVGFRGKAFDAMAVSHAETLVAAAGSVAEGYRYADAPDGSTLHASGKAWSIDGALVDLCYPNGTSLAYDTQDTRWPLDAARKSTVDTPYWGASVLSGLALDGDPLASLTLRRIAAPKLHFLAPLVSDAWEMEVPPDHFTTGGGDDYDVEHYCSRLGIADVDGRQGLEVPHVRRTDNYAPGRLWVSDYAHLSVATVASLIQEIPGWTATPSEGDEPSWFMGHGHTVAGGNWAPTFDVGAGTLRGQAIYDSMEWSDQVGDVFNVAGGSVLTLRGRKVFRGAAYGAVRSNGTVYASDIGGAAPTSAVASGKRYGLLGPTLNDPNARGLVWAESAHKAAIGGFPRRIQRIAFGIAQMARLLAYAVSASWRHTRAVDRGEGLAIDASPDVRPFPWEEGAALDSADWASLAHPTQDRDGSPVIFFGEHGGTATLARIEGEGASLVPKFTIGPADFGAHCFTPNGQMYTFRLSGGTIHSRLYDALLDPMGPEQATTITDADDSNIEASASIGEGGELRIHVQYLSGGNIVFATSPDGQDFT